VASLFDPRNRRYAGRAILGLGVVLGGMAGYGLQDSVCREPPAVARLAFVGGAMGVIVLDLGYRALNKSAALAVGPRRFVDFESGGALLFVPVWLIGLALFVWSMIEVVKHGVC
jgi:hypothetical protein